MSLASWVSMIMTLAPTANAPFPPETDPIQLRVDDVGDALRVEVVGRSSTAYRASFTVIVQNDVSGGGNRTRQSGVAVLQPDIEAKLLNVTMTGTRRGGWQVEMTVDPDAGPPYSRRIASDDRVN